MPVSRIRAAAVMRWGGGNEFMGRMLLNSKISNPKYQINFKFQNLKYQTKTTIFHAQNRILYFDFSIIAENILINSPASCIKYWTSVFGVPGFVS